MIMGPFTSILVTVGGPGSSTTNGNGGNGGTSSFGSYLTATGGAGGVGGGGTAGGGPGTGGGNLSPRIQGSGSWGTDGTAYKGGNGGDSLYLGGARGSTYGNAPNAGSVGAGGGGTTAGNDSVTGNTVWSGWGSSGIVIIWEFF
jgi:hypothetical protein